MNRREFLKASGIIGAAAVAAPYVRGAEAGKKYNTAIIGAGWWGNNILRCAMEAGESKIVGVCDVDDAAIERTLQAVEKGTGDRPKKYKDFRELLTAEKPEIVINATPDHWHPLVSIEAVKSGAHVYVEKPICHTVNEGIAMVKAARAADRVVQVGTHRRISPHNVSGMQFLRSGQAGKIGMVRAFVHYGGGPESPQANEEPKGIDWDMWCGPGPLRPFNRRIHPKGFRGFLDYANGTLGDWGIHWLDQILWIMEEKYPRRVFSTGGRPIKGKPMNGPEGQTSDAPDHQVAVFEFENFTVSWEHRQFGGNNAEKGETVGCYFYGTKGTFHMGWQNGWTFYPVGGGQPMHQDPQLHDPDKQNIKEVWADLLDAIKNKRRPVCDIELGQRSTTMALLGMLSMKLGRSVQWDGEKQTIVGDEAATKLLSRAYRGTWKYPEI